MSKIGKIISLDHLVLTVASIPKTISFYQRLGMVHETFKTPTETRRSLKFGQSKINLHEKGYEFEPKAQTALPGTADLCFIVEDDVESILSTLKALKEEEKVEMEEKGEIVDRTGARGKLRSLYLRDPDGNLIELSNYNDSDCLANWEFISQTDKGNTVIHACHPRAPVLISEL